MFLRIRREMPVDIVPIGSVMEAAFGRADESHLVSALRQQGYARLSLVAETDGDVVGHILFSALIIETPTAMVPGVALAPLAVAPAWQNQGVGSQLARDGLAACREQGHRIALVVGHPSYYPRFGFSAELARQLESPYAGDAFMALELARGALSGVRGRVVYAPPFGGF